MLNDHEIYEDQVYLELSSSLISKGWVLKKGYGINHYDISLFKDDVIRTFIEIKRYKNKSNFQRLKNRGEEQIRKSLNGELNFGILFINGELFIVGEKTSEKIKSFPEIDEYNWRKDSNSSFIKKKDDYPNNYDKVDVNIFRSLLEIERIKNAVSAQLIIELQNKIITLNKEVNEYRELLFNNIEYVRESRGDLELKIKLIDSYFNQYLSLPQDTIVPSDNNEIKWCDNWGALEVNSKVFIIEAQNLYKYVLNDYTAYVQGLTKAFENEILKKIFCNFLDYYNSSNLDLNYKITDSNNRGTIVVFRNFLKNGDIDGFLSLDQMRYIICAIFSDTQDKSLITFKPIYLKYFKQMNEIFIKGGNLNKIKDIRNIGAHTSPINQKLANDFSQIFNSTFNDFISNYKITT